MIVDRLKPKACPNCLEPNKIDFKFCAKCRMVLTYDEYVQTLEQQKEKQDEIEDLKKQVNENTANMNDVLHLLKLRMENDDTVASSKKYDKQKEKLNSIDENLAKKEIKTHRFLI